MLVQETGGAAPPLDKSVERVGQVQCRVWLPRALYDQLREQAQDRNRSFQRQLVHVAEIGAVISDRSAAFERAVVAGTPPD